MRLSLRKFQKLFQQSRWPNMLATFQKLVGYNVLKGRLKSPNSKALKANSRATRNSNTCKTVWSTSNKSCRWWAKSWSHRRVLIWRSKWSLRYCRSNLASRRKRRRTQMRLRSRRRLRASSNSKPYELVASLYIKNICTLIINSQLIYNCGRIANNIRAISLFKLMHFWTGRPQ